MTAIHFVVASCLNTASYVDIHDQTLAF